MPNDFISTKILFKTVKEILFLIFRLGNKKDPGKPGS